jgi:hypothetical protein
MNIFNRFNRNKRETIQHFIEEEGLNEFNNGEIIGADYCYQQALKIEPNNSKISRCS